MDIGEKIHRLRQKCGLTQEELADRTELSKGFISQLERDLTSPSMATLTDILECLGTNLREFFDDRSTDKIVFTPEDMFVKEAENLSITWLIPSAQKNTLEPILLSIEAGETTDEDDPHEGEEFGYVLSGAVTLVLGTAQYKVKKGDSFYFKTDQPHSIKNKGKTAAKVLWVSTPPSF